VKKEDLRFMPRRRRWVVRALLAAAALMIGSRVDAQTIPQGPNGRSCDASYQNCRTPLLKLISSHAVGRAAQTLNG
jgi:hypothetical protein